MDEAKFEDYESLMQETPDGVSAEDAITSEFLQEGTTGWGVVDTSRGTGPGGAVNAGMTAHRGVLHPDEYVHAEALESLLEENLGISLEQFDLAYRSRGKPSAEVAGIRERTDAKFLEVVESGGNVDQLARILGINDRRIYDAAERARVRRDVQ